MQCRTWLELLPGLEAPALGGEEEEDEESRFAFPEKRGAGGRGEKVYSVSTVTKNYSKASPSSASSHTTLLLGAAANTT